jgi:hydroxymethylglutaryl-CoA reductase (NADPH)
MLSQIANNISLTDPYIRSVTLSIFPPVFFKAVSVPFEGQGFLERGENAVGGFLEAWTRSVGDPVISKWIVVVLCVSMGLNAWLLNAARHGAMQPLYSSTTKSSAPDIVVDKPNKAANLSPAMSDGNAMVKTSPFTLNDSESDDDETSLSAIKASSRRVRSVAECMQILTEGRPQELLDEEVIALTLQKKIPLYALEKSLKDLERAVKIRRAAVCTIL